jgi:predicted dehydrogenase
MKILIVGCGSIGQRHARNLRDLGQTELLLFDPDENRAETLARELNAKAFGGIDDAYAEEPSIAMICAPTSKHRELAHEALENGCHLFIEKPLSNSLDGVQELIDIAEEQHRVLFVGYNFRFDMVAKQVEQWLREGKIGHVTSARFHLGSYLPWRHPWEDYRCGYGARRDLGGGVILDAVHELDTVSRFFGQPQAVYCVGGKYSDLEINVEDTAEIVLSYADKVVSVHLDFVQQPAQRWCEFTGARGSIRADLFARSARLFDADKRAWEQTEALGSLGDSYKTEMSHLIDCVEGRAVPLVDGRMAMESLLLAEKAKASLRSGLRVSVQPTVVGAHAG